MLHRCNVREWEWEGMGKSLMGIPWEWELVTKLGMGMNGNRLHGNGREWECKKPLPGISSSYLADSGDGRFVSNDLNGLRDLSQTTGELIHVISGSQQTLLHHHAVQ